MTIKISEGDTPVDSQFLDFFLKGNLSLEKARRPKPYEWFPDQGWQDMMRLVQVGSEGVGAGLKECMVWSARGGGEVGGEVDKEVVHSYGRRQVLLLRW
jgi:hypothetical protein